MTDSKQVKTLAHRHGSRPAEEQPTLHFSTSKYFALRHKVGSSNGEVIQILTNVIGEQIFQRHGQCVGEHL